MTSKYRPLTRLGYVFETIPAKGGHQVVYQKRFCFDSSRAGADAAAVVLRRASEVRRALINVVAMYPLRGATRAAAPLDELKKLLDEYLAVVLGFVPELHEPADKPNPLLRQRVSYTWMNVFDAQAKSSGADAVFELMSMMSASAIWMANLATAMLDEAQGTPTTIDEATTKLVYKMLVTCGQIMVWARQQAPLLTAPDPKPADMHPDVLNAMASLFFAQAQEVTVSRAMAKENTPHLIMGLCADTLAKYQTALDSFAGQNCEAGEATKPLLPYLRYKTHLFRGLAYHWQGVDKWKADSMGDAIASAKVALAAFASAKSSLSIWSSRRSRDIVARCIEHAKLADDEFYRYNMFVTYQHVPDAAPEPEPRSLLPTDAYPMPALDAAWTAEALAYFDGAAAATSGSPGDAAIAAGAVGAVAAGGAGAALLASDIGGSDSKASQGKDGDGKDGDGKDGDGKDGDAVGGEDSGEPITCCAIKCCVRGAGKSIKCVICCPFRCFCPCLACCC